MYLSLTHEVGEALNGGPVRKVEDYGYSTRGKGVIRVHGIRIGPGRLDGSLTDPSCS
jgi:hypothetical protein